MADAATQVGRLLGLTPPEIARTPPAARGASARGPGGRSARATPSRGANSGDVHYPVGTR